MMAAAARHVSAPTRGRGGARGAAASSSAKRPRPAAEAELDPIAAADRAKWRAGPGGRGGFRGRGAGATAAWRSGGAAPPPTRVPFYKRVPGTPLIVDGFQWASAATSRHYVLSHFHSDHTVGLTRHFACGVIYCTSITASLCMRKLGVRAAHLRPLALDTPTMLPGLNVRLTFIDANHCPGAVIALFETQAAPGGPFVRAHLHTGDFRFADSMAAHPALAPFARGQGHSPSPSLRRLDTLLLDTTYCEPKHSFPPQAACVAAALMLVERYAADKGVLFVFGAYQIGKERLWCAVARLLRTKVLVDATRMRTISALEDPLLSALVTTDPRFARVRVLPMSHLTVGKMQALWRECRGGEVNASAPAMSATKLPVHRTPNAVKAAKMRIPTGLSAAAKRSAKSRGPLYQALLEQSSAAAAAERLAEEGEAEEVVEDEEEDEEGGGFFRRKGAVVATTSSAFALLGESARQQAMMQAEAVGPFHSVVVFRPTGWSFAPSAGTGKAEEGGGIGAVALAAQAAAELGIAGSEIGATQGLREDATTWRNGQADEDKDEEGADREPAATGGGPAAAEGVVDLQHKRQLHLQVPVAGSVVPCQVHVTVQTRGGKGGAREAGSSAVGGGGMTLYSLPYSEHSSFAELRRCVARFAPESIIPTVNCRSSADCARIVAQLRPQH